MKSCYRQLYFRFVSHMKRKHGRPVRLLSQFHSNSKTTVRHEYTSFTASNSSRTPLHIVRKGKTVPSVGRCTSHTVQDMPSLSLEYSAIAPSSWDCSSDYHFLRRSRIQDFSFAHLSYNTNHRHIVTSLDFISYTSRPAITHDI